MTTGWIELVAFVAVLLVATAPLGAFIADVLEGRRTWLSPALAPIERSLWRVSRIDPESPMDWRRYAGAMLAFNVAGLVLVYAVQRLQGVLPLNPAHLKAVSPHLAFNTAVSFATNTNWQSYSGEQTLSHLTQMLALTSQNFVSAASGIAVLAALVRGFARRSTDAIGNFWADLVRVTLYVLLPLSLALALALVSRGVVQTFAPGATATTLEGAPQHIALGPVASQVAIKQLCTNGGGFFNVNSAHPFENPDAVTCWLELFAILLLPAALCHTFGRMAGDRRQGWAVLAAMTLIFVACAAAMLLAEQHGNPRLAALGIDASAGPLQAGGNMEGKEARFGIGLSALWATATTAASNGSVNAMHDAFTPLGGMVAMGLMQLGEVVYGGVGSGLYGMLAFAIVAVFVAGLMVGRTPEYLGKKIDAFEMQMASLVVLVPPFLVLVGTAVSVVTRSGVAGIANPGIHGFGEILYAFSSASNNNGSAFAGLSANTPWYDGLLGIAMFAGRFWLAIPVLAIAGSLARKKAVPVGAGTLPTHTPLFVLLLVATVLIVGALTFVPALALGPIAEHFALVGGGS